MIVLYSGIIFHCVTIRYSVYHLLVDNKSEVGIYLRCFHFLTIRSNVAMSIPVLDSMWAFVFICYWGTLKMFYKVAVPFYILTNNVWIFQFIRILPILLNRLFSKILSILVVVYFHPIVILICVSLITDDYQHFFHGLLAICVSYLEKCFFFIKSFTAINFPVSIALVASVNCLCY